VSFVREWVPVRHEYRHALKSVSAGRPIELGDAALKWYAIALPDEGVPPEVERLARRSLADAARLGELRLGSSLGFVVLHRCGGGFYFLLVSTWQNDNELWETVWAKDGDDDPDFHPWPLEGTHRPTFCVWELGAVAHERLAWSAYLLSERDVAARDAYLRDTYEGVV
jgi:hypothetical protein